MPQRERELSPKRRYFQRRVIRNFSFCPCTERFFIHAWHIDYLFRIAFIIDCRAATALPDGRTLRITPVPKGMKEQLDQGRLRESRKELEAAFDRVLGEGAEQEEIYNQIKTCVRLPFSGEHVVFRVERSAFFSGIWPCDICRSSISYAEGGTLIRYVVYKVQS